MLCNISRDPHVVNPEELDDLGGAGDLPRGAGTGDPQPARAVVGVEFGAVSNVLRRQNSQSRSIQTVVNDLV